MFSHQDKRAALVAWLDCHEVAYRALPPLVRHDFPPVLGSNIDRSLVASFANIVREVGPMLPYLDMLMKLLGVCVISALTQMK